MTDAAPAPTSNTAPPTRYNAVRHGLLSQYAVLPWESRDEYEALLFELAEEHAPVGPTETHFVEEIAGIFWRKRRLRIAEAAIYREELRQGSRYNSAEEVAEAALLVTGQSTKVDLGAALSATPDDTAKELRDLRQDQTMTRKALTLLQGSEPEAYAGALAVLRDDTREHWLDCLAEPDNTDLEPTTEALRAWLNEHWQKWFEEPIAERKHRETVREQAFGMAYATPKLEGLARYETHLDRKLERTLSALFRLRELRNMGQGKAA